MPIQEIADSIYNIIKDSMEYEVRISSPMKGPSEENYLFGNKELKEKISKQRISYPKLSLDTITEFGSINDNKLYSTYCLSNKTILSLYEYFP